MFDRTGVMHIWSPGRELTIVIMNIHIKLIVKNMEISIYALLYYAKLAGCDLVLVEISRRRQSKY